jgi:hypothetical protein
MTSIREFFASVSRNFGNVTTAIRGIFRCPVYTRRP